MRRIAPFVWAVLAYTVLLNLALNSDLLLLRHFALAAPGVDATAPRPWRETTRRCARSRCCPTRRCWW